MKVFVTGGTGAIGGHAVPALIGKGHTVTALAGTPEKAAVLAKHGAEPVSVSIFDRAALTAAFSGHDAVVNLASAIPPMSTFMDTKAWRDNDQLRTEGSAAVVDAAIAAGVERVVQESVSMLYPDRGTEWIDEDVPTDCYPMARGNLAAESNAKRFSDAGGTGIVLRFGWFYGPGARVRSGQKRYFSDLALTWRKPPLKFLRPTSGAARWKLIGVRYQPACRHAR